MTISGIRAVLIDVGYGGFRVAVPNAEELPPSLLLHAQGLGKPVRAHRVWEQSSDDPAIRFCGASLDPGDLEGVRKWQQCVDAWQPHA